MTVTAELTSFHCRLPRPQSRMVAPVAGIVLARWTSRTRTGATPDATRCTSTRSRSATGSGCSTSPGATITWPTCGCCARLTGSAPSTRCRRTRRTSAVALAELAAVHEDVPAHHDLVRLRERLDALADDQILHRLEDASRAGSLARYRNRQSVYQFSELGYRAYAAVEDVLAARIRDANLSRLVFSDILDDLRALAAAVAAGDQRPGVPAAVTAGHRPRRHVPPRGAVPPDAGRAHAVDRHLARDVPEVQERAAHPHDRFHGRARPLPAPAGGGDRRDRRRGRGRDARPGRAGRRPAVPVRRRQVRRLASALGGAAGLVRRRRVGASREPPG